jgi:ribosomal protein S18 acetylase RimI-like enzyme
LSTASRSAGFYRGRFENAHAILGWMGDTETLTIVSATQADLAAVAALAGVVWRRHYPGIITREQIEYMLANGYSHEVLSAFITEEGSGLELARAGDRLIGFGAYQQKNSPRELKLEKLYIHQDFQGRGVGSRLIAKIEGAARAQNCSALILNVNKSNVQAIRAYEKNGFAIREAVVVDIGDGFVMDDYIMTKSL